MHKDEPVSRLMTEAVLSIAADEPAGEVLRLFREYPVHHLPVVDDRRVIGMLSGADLLKLRAMVPKSVASAEDYLSAKMNARALISRPAVTITQHETVERASELMAHHGIHSLPVVDSTGHLVGILTTTDIIGAVFEGAPARAGGVVDAHAHSAQMTRDELGRAVVRAAAAVNEGGDPDGFAAALVYAQQRIALLETVASLAARFVASGIDLELHAALVKALEQARAANAATTGDVSPQSFASQRAL